MSNHIQTTDTHSVASGSILSFRERGPWGNADSTNFLRSFSGTGTFRWEQAVGTRGSKIMGITSSDTILIHQRAGGAESLVALDYTGTTQEWQVSNITRPVTDENGNIYASSVAGADVTSLDPNGAEKWKVTLPNETTARVDFIDTQGHVYVRGSKTLYALNTSDGSVGWSFIADADLAVGAVLGPAGDIFLSDINKTLYLLDTCLGYANSAWPSAEFGNRRHTEKVNDTLPLPAGCGGPLFSLAFPLAGLTPYTAEIRSVMDHYNYGIDSQLGCYDGTIVTYKGDRGDVIHGKQGGGVEAYPYCEDKTRLGNYYTPSQGVFLSYDGHPGYDYPIAGGDKKAPPVPILAAADGTVIRVNMGKKINTGKKPLGEIWIDHENGLCTMYNHLSQAFVDTEENKNVMKGQPIGMSGSTGAKFHHLRFSVFICPATNPLRYVDPYGWDPRPGADVFVDPHTETSVCLWDTCQ